VINLLSFLNEAIIKRSAVLSLGLCLIGSCLIYSGEAFAQHKGISFQAVMKRPDGTYPTVSGLSVTLQILDPVSDCVLREEVHSGVNISNGYINIVLGSATAATPAGKNPNPILTIPQVMDNATPRTGLNCVDANDNIASSGQTYTPSVSHSRKLRLRALIGGDTLVADFNMRAIPFAVNAENLDGKDAAAFVQTTANTTQTKVESIFSRYGTLDSILSGTFAGNAATATALAAAPGACPAGQYLSAMSASGTITCGTPIGGGGTVTSVTSGNAFLSVATGTTTPVLTVNVGTVANTVAAGNDARFTDSRAPNGTAGGDLSGTYPNPSVAKVSGKSVLLTTPIAGDVLTYDGAKFVNSPGADATKLPLAGGTMSGAIDMGSQNLTNVGYLTMSANKNLHLSNNAADPAGLVAADKGKIWFNSTSGVIKYWDGSAAQPLGVAGSGLTSFNSQTGSSQTLAIGTSGTAPAWSSASNTHTLNIPMASTATVTAGLLSKADYDTFNAKLGTATAFSGDVSGAYNATSVDKIKGKTVTPGAYAAGQTLRYDGTDWVNSVLAFADLGSKPTTLAGYGITDAQSSTLADGKILVGNASNVATAVTMSGDATLSNAGALTLATVPLNKGGTGVTSFTGDKLITTSAAGALQASSCALNEVISFTAGGAINCVNVNSLFTGFTNGGNSFGAAATLGTNDAYALNLKTNNATQMTILTDGKVGIGTATPTNPLSVAGNANFTGRIGVGTAPGANTGINSDLTSTQIAASVYGATVQATYSPTASTSFNVYGETVSAVYSAGLGKNSSGSIIGIDGAAGNGSPATVNSILGGNFHTSDTGFGTTSNYGLKSVASSSNTTTSSYGLYSEATMGSGFVTNGYGVRALVSATGVSSPQYSDARGVFSEILNSSASGTITNGYGIYVGSVQATNKWSVYANDATAPSYFAGNVGIGTATPAGILDVQGGTAAAAANATDIKIFAQSGGSGSTNGGSILLFTGTRGTSSGMDGKIFLGGDGRPNGVNALVQIKGTSDGGWPFLIMPYGNSGYSQVWASPNGAYEASVDYAGNASFPSVTAPIIKGSGSASGNLTLDSTAHATKGFVNIAPSGGNVGIGTTTPSAKLEVQGQIVSKVYDNGSATTFNLNNGNGQYTSASCGAMTLQNMVDGGAYTIAVQGAASGTCTFTDATGSRTFKFSPANGATTASSHSIYSMQVMGSYVYVSWITGF
jgi:hypothetical protein